MGGGGDNSRLQSYETIKHERWDKKQARCVNYLKVHMKTRTKPAKYPQKTCTKTRTKTAL